uniref:Uncharacterized protein n=1 Tax=Arundo donax TaxID=35708 RepID=A0A0A9AU71_ARUDO
MLQSSNDDPESVNFSKIYYTISERS